VFKNGWNLKKGVEEATADGWRNSLGMLKGARLEQKEPSWGNDQ